MKWNYEPEYMEDGELKKASGQYTFADCLFPFRVRKPPSGKYPYEAHVRLLSPATGKHCKWKGSGAEKRRKHSRLRKRRCLKKESKLKS